MIRAVLDANVLVSGFPAEQGSPADLLAAWAAGDFELVLSEHILSGAVRAWGKPYYRSRYTEDHVQQALNVLRADATIVVPVDTVRGVGNDEEDDLVLATAVAGQVPYLVTGDKGLLEVGRYQGITILAPRAFLALLAQHGGDARP